jgi:hypothetical protein
MELRFLFWARASFRPEASGSERGTGLLPLAFLLKRKIHPTKRAQTMVQSLAQRSQIHHEV